MDQVTEEQAGASAGLDAVLAEAEALESGAAAKVEQAQEAQAASEQEQARAELREALGMLRMMAAPAMDWWPMFAKVWSDQQLDAISAAGAAVMMRHGWTMGELMGQWGPYLALVGAVLPPSLVTYQAIRQHREEQQRQVTRPAPPPPAGNVHPIRPQDQNPSAGERL